MKTTPLARVLFTCGNSRLEKKMEVHSEKDEKTKPKSSTVIFYAKALWKYVKDHGQGTFSFIKIGLLTLFLLYVAVPIFVRANQWILPKVVFCNILRWPPFINLSHPSDFGLNYTRNFYLHVEDGIDIGAWHTLPKSMHDEKKNIPWESFEDELDNGKIVFLYLHGNSGTRGSYHRVQLYKLLSRQDFHVVTIDYRGYGDSSGSPTENGVVADAYHTYKWLKKRIGKSKIFIWGHSLGTGITTKLTKKLSDEGDHPAGIVLESPFNNIQEAAFNHPFASPYRMLPWFEWIFVDGIGEHGIFFNSEESIESVIPNIMMLHAKDDFIVPFHLGEKLYARAKGTRHHKTGDVEFVDFEGHLGYGHKLIYQAPELPELIRKFVSKSK
ncbi:lysophosphatidylserine lipase ABHD12 [Aplysia californica]|uniref:Lysophosphatidylserine lipase ABHD12 n=1 Tax=Aplysia californica TaxID=6500 RepID=A0ABM0JZ90_APLCA|nr:lysophosphatidylserine lipase ABHD12 [Aplysia californica]